MNDSQSIKMQKRQTTHVIQYKERVGMASHRYLGFGGTTHPVSKCFCGVKRRLNFEELIPEIGVCTLKSIRHSSRRNSCLIAAIVAPKNSKRTRTMDISQGEERETTQLATRNAYLAEGYLYFHQLTSFNRRRYTITGNVRHFHGNFLYL